MKGREKPKHDKKEQKNKIKYLDQENRTYCASSPCLLNKK
jgi:hypothetical protein